MLRKESDKVVSFLLTCSTSDSGDGDEGDPRWIQGGQQIGGQIVTKLHYADNIILLATSKAELQELVYRLDRVSCKYSLLINIDKTKVMALDGIACRVLI